MTARDYRSYVEALNKASLLAQRELSALWDSLEGAAPEQVRDALIEFVPAIVERYGGMAALAAAEYYEAERAQAGGGDFAVELSGGVPAEQVRKSVRYACGHLFPEEGDDGAQPEPDADLFGGRGR